MTVEQETPQEFGAESWEQILTSVSFLELTAQARAEALLDEGSLRVLAGPFDRIESPWLLPQGIIPQSDDGVVIAQGTINNQPVVLASIEQKFLGGGTGEVSGAKIATALRLAAKACREGTTTAAVILFETGGVRLQEANLGLNAVAEICSAVLDLRTLAPVVGLIAGAVGSFGGVSIAAGLCSHLVVTREARLGLNGPAVIEQEAGVDEFDSTDRGLIWAVDGGEQRFLTGLVDDLVFDDVAAIREHVTAALEAGVRAPGTHRSQRLDVLSNRLSTIDPQQPMEPLRLRELWGRHYEPVSEQRYQGNSPSLSAQGRGISWVTALGGEPEVIIPSVVKAHDESATYLAVVADPANPFHRAREGEVGLRECLFLAQAVRGIIDDDHEKPDAEKRAIIAIIDLPSQAYGLIEESAGLHQAIATTVDAYHTARNAGHPVIALVVGTALSGGFLAHGFQANQILAFDDDGVEIHAMHKPAAARITRRTVEELENLATTVKPLSYHVRDWAELGFCDELLTVSDPDTPTPADITAVREALHRAIDRSRTGPRDLTNRLRSTGAEHYRAASLRVRDALEQQWQ